LSVNFELLGLQSTEVNLKRDEKSKKICGYFHASHDESQTLCEVVAAVVEHLYRHAPS
jgi:hypothetical protein